MPDDSKSLITAAGETSAAAVPPAAKRGPSRKTVLRYALLILGPVVVAAAALYFYLHGGRYVSTDNAYVRADKITISSEVAGKVAEIPVANDQQVEAGTVLYSLDDEPYRIALNSAKAQLGMVGNDIQALQATYREKLASIARAEADVAYYKRDLDRQKELAARQNASQAKLDEAQRNMSTAEQNITMMRSEAAATLASLDGDPGLPLTSYSRYRQAQAQVDKAERDLRLTVVRAPRTGIVTNVDKLQKGMYLAVGQAAVSLVATDHIWIEANPKESDLGQVKPGQPASVTIDTYPGVTWQGSVESISPATGNEFAILPAQNSSGNWVKVVQRIPVRLRLDQLEGKPTLRAGMSAVIDIDTGNRRTLSALLGMVQEAVAAKPAGGDRVDQPK